MYCMKALGVVHFKGNLTNKNDNKIKTVHTAFIMPFQLWNTPPKIPTVINNGQSSLEVMPRRHGHLLGVCFSVCV